MTKRSVRRRALQITKGGDRARRRGIFIDLSPLVESPPYRRLWSVQALSRTGTMITGVAVAYQVYQITHSSLAVGLIGLCEAIPVVFFGLLGTSFVDSVDAQRLVLATTTLLAVSSALLALQSAMDWDKIWVLFVLAAVQAALSAIDTPVGRTFMPKLLPAELYSAANALAQLTFQAAIVIGPILSGLIIARFGTTTTYVLDAMTFLAALYGVGRLPTVAIDHTAPKRGWESIRGGLDFLRRTPILSSALILDLNATIFGMPMALFPALSESFHPSGPRTLGFLYAAPAVGGVLMALLSGGLGRVRRPGRALLLAVAVWGVTIALVGLFHNLWLALTLLAVAGASDMISAVYRSSLLQTLTPAGLLGRVNSVGFVGGQSGPMLGGVEGGAVASVTNPFFSVASGGIACLVGLGLMAVVSPSLWRYYAGDARDNAEQEVPTPEASAPVSGTGAPVAGMPVEHNSPTAQP